VTGVVALVILLVIATGSATYALLRPFLVGRLDQQLSPIAAGISEGVQACVNRAGIDNCVIGKSSADQVSPRAAQHEWINTFTATGVQALQVQPDVDISELKINPADLAKLIASNGVTHTVTTQDGIELRMSIRAVTTRQGVIFVMTGLSTQDVNHTLQRLLLLEVAIGASAVALAACLTAWGVRAGLRPLHRVTRTAQEVTAELGPDGAGLERRVRGADPSTEVGQVASSVNTLLGAVQNEFAARVRSEDRMRQFLADASHELRTPLTSIRGYAELSRLQGQSTNSAEDPMRRIEVEGTRMSRLVEDLLVLARGDDQDSPAVREPVDVDSLLTDALVTSESTHPERRFELARSGGATVLGDRDQLLRMVLNLLNNAAVHTRPDGPIRLEGVAGRVPSGPAVALRVIDAGPGLPAEEAAHVFERFWRADKARSRAKGGSGLGMAIVAQIANGHGGSVAFESTVEAGTTVTVTLPMAPPAQRFWPGGDDAE
jgi:two-component system OmpR family sensor kinase